MRRRLFRRILLARSFPFVVEYELRNRIWLIQAIDSGTAEISPATTATTSLYLPTLAFRLRKVHSLTQW